MDVRTRLLEAATRLLAESASGDVSTRAVCELAGVAAPALYRQFGDKEGLLRAVADTAFERYLASKRALVPSDDPVADLRAGWDGHVAFGLANPNSYRLMFAASMSAPPSAQEAYRLLLAVLERCAAAGRLCVSSDLAAQMIMSANVGVTLLLIGQPGTFDDPALSHRVRDAVHAAILATPAPGSADTAAAGDAVSDYMEIARLASGLAALLRRTPARQLSAGESVLIQEWLARLSNT